MNSLIDMLYFCWPWIGLGGGIVLLILLLFTDVCRSDTKKSRFLDPVWLSWAISFVYLPHVCEEYGMHVANGQYELITKFQTMGVDEMFGGIPLVFFPLVNIIMTWIALPVIATQSKKHPIIGLSGMGFILTNGLTHIGGSLVGKMSISENAGVFTGIFLFLPLFFWICNAVCKENLLPRKGLRVAILSGVAAHILLFMLYVINKIAGPVAACICIPVVCFSPALVCMLLCKIFHIKDKA